jgi:hypothetical protein
MIPEGYKDYNTVVRGWRPRIDESYYEEQIQMEKRFYGSTLPSVIVPNAN